MYAYLADFLSDELLDWVKDSDDSLSDEEMDQLMLIAINTYEHSNVDSATTSSTHRAVTSVFPNQLTSSSLPPTCSSRFARPKTNEEIDAEIEKRVPKRTKTDTKYCVNLWEQWRKSRQNQTDEQIDNIEALTNEKMDYWLTRFILEVRKKDGSEYPPNTLYHITAGLMRYVRWNGKPQIDFFKDASFSKFRATLDAEMKNLQRKGIGTKKKKAEIFTEEEEELLWQKGILGDSTPNVLLNTIVFYNGLYFALRSGGEHRQLRSNPCQIEVIDRPGERAFLKYTEDISKNRPGGLNGRKVVPKVVIHHANTNNPSRCFVRLFRLYRQMLPDDVPAHAFYFRPLVKPTKDCWYSKLPLGHNLLSSTVPRICKLGGIQGFKTNHSLRATATSRLYQSGVDEQLVMERTGHRSLDGVCSYKRTSDQQREALSDILNMPKKREAEEPNTTAPTVAPTTAPFLSSQHLRALNLPTATFNSCTVNFHVGSHVGFDSSTNDTRPEGNRATGGRKKRPMVLYSDSDSD